MVVKLADTTTHEAWEEFKTFLVQSGFLLEVPEGRTLPFNQEQAWREKERVLQMAFKQGYVEGANLDPQPPQEQPEPKRRIKRAPRNTRSQEQRNRDNLAVEVLLQDKTEPMPLGWILENMRRRHFTHWNNGNASGFVQRAIKDGMAIEKAGNGFYRYKKGANE